MADRFPIILNTSANQLQEIASGDTLDVSGAGVKANLVDSLSVVGTGVSIVGVITATSADINGDLDVDGHTNLDNVSIAGVVTATTINATTFAGALVGNSATATKLETARTIGGVSFDGTANINLPGVNASGNQDTSGNAATATALQNARTIGGVSFNGTSNINLPGVNASGNQDTSGTAAVATNVTVSANNSTNETVYPVFVDGATGSQGAETDTGLTYNPSTGNLSATTFTGNLTGNTTGTIQTAAQPNITSVGTLSSLNVSGNVSIGGTLTYEDVTNIDSIGVVTARSGLVSPNADIDDFVSVGSNIHLGNAGVVTATSFSGSGANLTSLPAGQLTGALPAISGANLTGISQVGGANSVRFNDDVKAFFGSSSSTDCEIVRNSNAVAGQTSLTVKSDLPFIVSTTNTSSIQFYVNNNSGNNGLIFDNNGLKPSSNNNVKLGSSSYKYNSLYAVNVFATTLFGDGSNLTGIDSGIPGISTTGISTFRDVQVGGAMTCTGTIVNKIDATTENAVVIGFEANLLNTNTDGSVIIGHRAGYQNATGKGNNVFVGRYAGYAGGGTQGSSNAIVGDAAGMFMYDNASRNAALGTQAGYYFNANDCVAVGAYSNYGRGEHNTAIGGYAYGPGNSMNTNYMTYPNNTSANQWGDNNIVIGYQANLPNSDVDNYIVIGNKKNTNFVVGTLGVEVTAGVTTHSGSVVVGAGVSVVGIVTAANFLKADGSAVGGVTSDATYNTIGGTGAGNALTSSGRDNTFFGHEAGNDVTSGDYNSIFGAGTGEKITTGGHNTLLGADAGRKMTAGSDNTCIGKSAGEDLGTGSFGTNITGCVMIGKEAGKSMQSGNYNVMVGYQAGQHMLSGRSNICMGYLAGQGTYNNCTGSYNIAIGESNLYTVQGGSYNHVVGRYAGHSITSGSYNICIGDKAGAVNTYNGNSGDLTTGSNNIIIGKEAQASSATVSNEITLGNSSITTFRVPGIGFNASGTGHLDVTGNSARFRTIESGGATVEIRSGGAEGYVGTSSNHKVSLITNSTRRWEISGAGHFIPYANGSYDIGSSSYRVRNLYTNDLNLSNEGSKNDVDGTWGNYTIQEGESDLFLINKRNGKKYKFNLTEVS